MKNTVRKLSLAMLLLTLVSASAANITRENVEKSRELIQHTVEAYGGAETLQNLQQILIEYHESTVANGQSVGTEPPWDTREAVRKVAFDFQNQIAVTEYDASEPGEPNHTKQIAKPDQLINLDLVRKTQTIGAGQDFDTRVGPSMRSNGTLLAKRLQQFSGSARYLGTTNFNDTPHELLSFTMPGGPAITLYIDAKTHLITKSERVIGNFLVEYYFKDYKKVGELVLPHVNSYSVDGEPSQTFTVRKYEINQPFESLVQIPEGFIMLDPPLPTEMKTHKLASDVYWVTQNGSNSLFVEFDDHMIMVGGLPGVTGRIAEIAKTVKDKPVKYAVLTHHHNDHIGGSQEIFDAGITFIAAKEHETVIRNALREEDRSQAKFHFVDKERSYASGEQRLELHDIGPTDHAEHFILAYVPKDGIIFEADHYRIYDSGPAAFRTQRLVDMVDAIQQRGLKVKTIASSHSSRTATVDEMMETYNKVYKETLTSKR